MPQNQGRPSSVTIQPLECRRLLAGAPAQLLARLPQTDEFINYDFHDSAVLGNQLVVSGFRFGQHEQLWAALQAGTSPTLLFTATDISPDEQGRFGIGSLTPFNGKVYFFANGTQGDGLYATDGTPAGTTAVKILRPASQGNVLPFGTVVLNDRLYFFWQAADQPVRLWSSDGTTAGTVPVWDAPPDTQILTFSPVIDGHVFFGGSGNLWRTDGTTQGTQSVWDGLDVNDFPGLFAATPDKLFFVQLGFGRRRLFAANRDGSGVTRIILPAQNPQSFEAIVNSSALTVVGNRVLFGSREPQTQQDRLFSTDGTPGGLVQLAGGRVEIYNDSVSDALAIGGGRAIFSQGSFNASKTGVWITDGTTAGTARISPSNVSPYFASDGQAFLNTPQSNVGYRIFRTDGTTSGTGPVFYIGLGDVGTVRYLNTFQDRLIVQAVAPNGIPELWSLDPDVSTGSITGKAYRDTNRNAIQEGFEPHHSGNTGQVYLDIDGNNSFNAQVDPFSLATDDRPYLFDGLPPELYTVRHTDNLPMSTPIGGEHIVNLAAGQNVLGADFAFLDNSQTVIWGRVFNDLNANGQKDPSEPFLSGQDLYVDLNKNRLFDYGSDLGRQSWPDGTWGVILGSGGTFDLRHQDMPGWRQTVPPGRQGMSVTVGTAQVVEAPLIGVVAAAPGSITGSVWNDWNQNGIRDGADSPASGITAYIDLNDDGAWSGPEPQQTTNSNGVYTFSNVVPDTYRIRLTGLTASQRQISPPPNQGYQIVLPEGGTAIVGDFMILSTSAVPPAGAISGMIWSDWNSNGVHDGNEPLVSGHTVWIDLDNDKVRDWNELAATSNGDGVYSFGHLRDGSYTLRQELPAGWTQTSPADAHQVTISGGSKVLDRHFGAHSGDTIAPSIVSGSYDFASNRFRVVFSEDILPSIGTGDLRLDNPMLDAIIPAPLYYSYDPATYTAIFTPNGKLVDGDYSGSIAADAIYDIAGNSLTSGLNFTFWVLLGDLNRDRAVTIADFITLSSNFGKANATYADGDVNYDGEVSIADFIDLSANFNASLPVPAPASAPQPAAFETVSTASPTTDLLQTDDSPAKKRHKPAVDWRKPHHLHHRRRRILFRP